MELTTSRVALPARLDPPSVAALAAALDAAMAAPTRVVVLGGATADVFCHGLAIDAADDGAATTDFAALFTRLHASPKPLLAVVDGEAIGGGFGLACACDWVVASERATFALPELLWGLVPAIIWPAITDRMAPHVARQWTIAAHSRGAREAQAAGAVDDVVAGPAIARAETRAVRMLGRLEPGALGRLRAWARESRSLPLAEAVAHGARLTAAMMNTPRVQTRWRAFTNGEAPWCA